MNFLSSKPWKSLNGFNQRELIGDKYWDDPRWEEVRNLRKEGEDLKANGLVMKIRQDFGID